MNGGVRADLRGSQSGRRARLQCTAGLRVARGWRERSRWQCASGSRSDRGSASFLVIGILVVVIALALVGLTIGGYLVALHRARTAADLAALSGAAAFATGASACPAARQAAAENRSTLVSCDQVGDQLDFVITARVRVTVGLSVAGLPRSIDAVAYAGAESS